MAAMLQLPISSVKTPPPPRFCRDASIVASKQSRRSRPNLSKVCQKTKMCSYYLNGACTRDKDCNFAHDPSEIQAKPDLSGTKMCPALLSSGHCPRMGTCKFAHREEEMRRIDIEMHDAPEAPRPSAQETTPTGTRSTLIQSTLSPMPMSRKARDTQQISTCLNDATVSGALAFGELVIHLTSIFSAMYATRLELASRVGVTANVLAQVTAEKAWVDAGLSSDSRLSFEEFIQWCSLPSVEPTATAPVYSVTSLTSHALRTKSQKDSCAALSGSSPDDLDTRSECSTDASEGGSPLSPPSSLSRSTSGWQTPARSEDLEEDVGHPVLNTFIHFPIPESSSVRRRSSSVPSRVSWT